MHRRHFTIVAALVFILAACAAYYAATHDSSSETRIDYSPTMGTVPDHPEPPETTGERGDAAREALEIWGNGTGDWGPLPEDVRGAEDSCQPAMPQPTTAQGRMKTSIFSRIAH